MGISDEERLQHIFTQVSSIYGLKDEFDKKEMRKSFQPVARLIPGIWHAMLRSPHYHKVWVAGCMAGVSDEKGNPWMHAILQRISEENAGEQNRGWELGEKPWWSIEMLLPWNARLVFMVYELTGTLAYALRRYDDDFRRQFRHLDAFVSELQGRCLVAFRDDYAFAKAQVASDLLALIGENHEALREENIEDHHLVHSVHGSVQDSHLTLREILDVDLWYRGGERTLDDGFLAIQKLMVGATHAPMHQASVSIHFIRQAAAKLGIDPVKVQQVINELPETDPLGPTLESTAYEEKRADRGYSFLLHGHKISTTPRYR